MLKDRVMELIEVLKKYQKTEGTSNLACVADDFANATENILNELSARDIEIAEIVDEYFYEKEWKIERRNLNGIRY